MRKPLLFFALLILNGIVLQAQLAQGPFDQLIIRGVTLINGNGAPPLGPVDVVVEKNVITQVKTVGYPGVEISDKRRPALKEGGKEINAEGMYLLPRVETSTSTISTKLIVTVISSDTLPEETLTTAVITMRNS